MLHKDMVLSFVMYMYISYIKYVQGCNQEYFMAAEVLAKKGTIYARYYSYITSVIYNALTSVTDESLYDFYDWSIDISF